MIEILGKSFICAPKRWRLMKIKIEADTLTHIMSKSLIIGQLTLISKLTAH